MNQDAKLQLATKEFVKACGRDYTFPMGGKVEMLTCVETGLLECLQNSNPSSSEMIWCLQNGQDWSNCYSIVIFGIRLAVLGVRDTNPDLLRTSILALIAGGPKIDGQDLLGAMSIVELCCNRLKLPFQDEIKNLVSQGCGDEVFRQTVEGYFLREESMRTVDVMGFDLSYIENKMKSKPSSG